MSSFLHFRFKYLPVEGTGTAGLSENGKDPTNDIHVNVRKRKITDNEITLYKLEFVREQLVSERNVCKMTVNILLLNTHTPGGQ